MTLDELDEEEMPFDDDQLEQLDLENSEVIDLDVQHIEDELPTETTNEVKDEIYKELQLKLEQRQNAEKDLESLRIQILEKENLLKQTNNEVEKLQQIKK